MAIILEDLPNELLDCIVDKLSRPDVRSLARLSRRFNSLATPYIYREITLRAFSPHLTDLTVLMLRQPVLSTYVHSFTISADDEYSYPPKEELRWPDHPDLDQLLRLGVDSCNLQPEQAAILLRDMRKTFYRSAILAVLLLQFPNLSRVSFNMYGHPSYMKYSLLDGLHWRREHGNKSAFDKLSSVEICQWYRIDNLERLCQAALYLPSIKRMRLRSIATKKETFKTALKPSSSSVEELDLDACYFRLVDVQKIVGSCKHLTHLRCKGMIGTGGTPQDIVDSFGSQCDSLEDLSLHNLDHWWIFRLNKQGVNGGLSFEDFECLRSLRVQAILLLGTFIDEDDNAGQNGRLETHIFPRIAKALPQSLRTIHFTGCINDTVIRRLERTLKAKDRIFPQVEHFTFELGPSMFENHRALLETAAKATGSTVQILEVP